MYGGKNFFFKDIYLRTPASRFARAHSSRIVLLGTRENAHKLM